jgi:hypothetical protein
MDTEQMAQIIDALVGLITAMCWPIVVLSLVYYFRAPLKRFAEKLEAFSFKAGPTGIEASAKTQELRDELKQVERKAAPRQVSTEEKYPESVEQRIQHRHEIENRSREVYLVHVLEPSTKAGQKFDIFVYLTKHRSDDLSDISFAEFFLGRYWGNKIFRVDYSGGPIGISTSAYGPVLCTCRVVFKDGHEAMLNRYIDFEMTS